MISPASGCTNISAESWNVQALYYLIGSLGGDISKYRKRWLEWQWMWNASHVILQNHSSPSLTIYLDKGEIPKYSRVSHKCNELATVG